jgi:hypothetical protein
MPAITVQALLAAKGDRIGAVGENAKWRQSGHGSACASEQAGAAHDHPLA